MILIRIGMGELVFQYYKPILCSLQKFKKNTEYLADIKKRIDKEMLSAEKEVIERVSFTEKKYFQDFQKQYEKYKINADLKRDLFTFEEPLRKKTDQAIKQSRI